MNKKIVFFGSIPIATECLKEIISRNDVSLLGVCCEKMESAWRAESSGQTVFDYCIQNKIRILELNELIELNPDLGISVRYNKILNDNVINSFRMGIVNTHGGILPEYRGSYCNINSIINNEQNYGVTLHYIDQGIDCGDVIDILTTDISENDTGFDLYVKSENMCLEIVLNNIDLILAGKNNRIKQKELITKGHVANTYKSKETVANKYIASDELSLDISIRKIRAFDSPFHEPSYTVLNGRKIYLRVKY